MSSTVAMLWNASSRGRVTRPLFLRPVSSFRTYLLSRFLTIVFLTLASGVHCPQGEVALMEKGLRTATVIAETEVTALSLTRR